MRNLSLYIVSLSLIASCNNPEKHYNNVIEDAGYISYKTPVSDTLPGALFSESTPDNLIFAGMHDECFPEDHLRHLRKTDIPQSLKKVSFSSSLDTGFFDEVGNEIFKLNYDSSLVKEVKLEMKGVTFEGMSFRRLARYFDSGMDFYCQEDLLSGDFTFVLGGMRVESLEFSFKNNANSSLKLTSEKLKELIDLDSDTSWEIRNDYTLVVNTPKYIGYHMGKIRLGNDGEKILSIATSYKHQKNKYFYEDVYKFGLRRKGFASGSWLLKNVLLEEIYSD
jgi:hypothetical protein